MIIRRICSKCGKEYATGYDALFDRELPRYLICLKTDEFNSKAFDVCFNCYSEIFSKLNKGDYSEMEHNVFTTMANIWAVKAKKFQND